MTAAPAALTSLRFVSARFATAVGRGAYCRSVPFFCPSVTSHLKRFTMALPFGASGDAVDSITQLKPAFGDAASPGAFVMEKFVGLPLSFEAAAAVAPAWLAGANWPLAFFMNASFMPAQPPEST